MSVGEDWLCEIQRVSQQVLDRLAAVERKVEVDRVEWAVRRLGDG